MTDSLDPTVRLREAIQRSDESMVREALQAGANVHGHYQASTWDGGVGTTVLIRAVLCKPRQPIVAQLLEHGADPNQFDSNGDTATSIAWAHARPFFPLLRAYGGDLERAHPDKCGVLLMTLHQMKYTLSNAPSWECEALLAGEDLRELIGMGLDWHRSYDGDSADRVLRDPVFPPTFVQQVLGWRAEHERQTLQALMIAEDHATTVENGRPRL